MHNNKLDDKQKQIDQTTNEPCGLVWTAAAEKLGGCG
jgi:hypothetical protein